MSQRVTARIAAFLLFVLPTIHVVATSFVVPDDAELIAKSQAIVVATVTDRESALTPEGEVETSYTLTVERVFKGNVTTSRPLTIVSPGGIAGGVAEHVDGTAHFGVGEHVLLFLIFDRGRWQTTDWSVGKFRFAGAELVRDDGAVSGWDREGHPFVDRARKTAPFLDFVARTVAGETVNADYFEQTESASAKVVANSVYPSYTYSNALFATSDGSAHPSRWTNARMTSGVVIYKNSTQNASGLGDGGVSVIQNGLLAWNNDAGSVVNLSYGGTTTAVKSISDGFNVVVFNDPSGAIAGSWTGSGIIAATFSYANGFDTFDGRSDWWTMSDNDIIYQDGLTGTNVYFAPAMTHEIGHLIGLRHSNRHWLNNDTACDSVVEECTSSAIMNSSVNTSYLYTLQPYDQNAVRALYPGSSCSDPYEPNETSPAAYGPIGEGSYLAKICTASDIDWYKADFVAGRTVTLTLSVPSGRDYDIEIYGPDGAFKVGSYLGTSEAERIDYVVPVSGRYVFRVYGYAGSLDTTSWYSLGYSSSGQNQTLSVSRNGTGSGTVTSSPSGISCGGTCSASFTLNTLVTLSASAASGSVFAGWSGSSCSGTGTCQVTMSQARSVTATFNAVSPALSVSLSGSGSGFVSSSPGGISCPGTCSAIFSLNTIVTLSAQAYSNSTFGGWSGACSGSGTCQLTMSQARSVTAYFNSTSAVSHIVRTDIDGDHASDISIFRPVLGTWYFRRSSNAQTTTVTNWGVGASDIPVPGDYDGDGIVDAAVFRPIEGNWYIRRSSTGALLLIAQWGLGASDKPVAADYDGDGKTDAAIFRPGTGEWFIRYSSNSQLFYVPNYGPLSGDVPVPGDYDGDGKADIAIFRPNLGNWYIRLSTTGSTLFVGNFGPQSSDKPVPADYDGDGKTDIAIFRPLQGGWYIRHTSNGSVTYVTNFGPQANDRPVPADYDGDGQADIAIFRPLAGDWFILRTTTGTTLYVPNYGPQSSDKPLPAYQN